MMSRICKLCCSVHRVVIHSPALLCVSQAYTPQFAAVRIETEIRHCQIFVGSWSRRDYGAFRRHGCKLRMQSNLPPTVKRCPRNLSLALRLQMAISICCHNLPSHPGIGS